MNAMKRVFGISVALVALTVGACTNKQGNSEAPVFLTVDIGLQPGFINVGVVAPIQIQTITIASHFKNPQQSDPQHFADVELNSYRVHFRRTDGGTLVPADQNFPAGVILPSGGSATLSNFPILPASSIQLSPFDQLLPFNGGVDRETGKDEIQMAFDLTFFGQTASGLRVSSTTASGILLARFAGSTPLSKSIR
jgi:hypothetical protein